MYRIAIDGACRGNGKPDCVSTGAAVVQKINNDYTEGALSIYYAKDFNSTNQRGELKGMLQALLFVEKFADPNEEVQIITDSEYIFNTLTKQWYRSWRNSNWITSQGNDVKNQDLWKRLVEVYEHVEERIIFYHTKGHCLSVGAVTANNLLSADMTGEALLQVVKDKYDADFSSAKTQERLTTMKELCARNMGFEPTPDIVKTFVVMNTMADLAASYYLSTL